MNTLSRHRYYNSTDRLPLGSLPQDEYEIAAQSIRRLLESPRAQLIMSRLIAGPDGGSWQTTLKEPPRPSRESISTYLEEIKNFSLEAILVDAKTLQQYQSADSSELKHRRLLEVVCAAIHLCAIWLYQKYHPQLPPNDATSLRLPPAYPEIQHANYFKYRRTGDLKAVGFWAEAQMLGGVVLFDRGLTGDECKSVWLHGKPHRDVNEVYNIPDSALFAALDSTFIPLDLSWEDLPHMSLAAAQDNDIYREFGLAHRTAYDVFAPLHPNEGVSPRHMEKALKVFLQGIRSG